MAFLKNKALYLELTVFILAEAFDKKWLIIRIKFQNGIAEWKDEYSFNRTGLADFLNLALNIVC